MKRTLLSSLLLLAAPLWCGAQSVYPGQHAGKMALPSVETRLQAFDLRDVRLLPSRFRDNLSRDSAWIASLDADRLLHAFRTRAGAWSGREGGYMTIRKLGGWESLDCDLRGHTTGHLMSACALMYAATGEEFFRLKGDSLVRGLAQVQQLSGTGYVSAFPEALIDRNIAGQSVWAPWYTLHKILAGLLDEYLLADNDLALQVARGMGDWAYEKLRGITPEVRRRMLRNEFGGMPESWWNLYAITGEERYHHLARFFYHDDVLDPLRAEHEEFGTKHTNTFLPKVLGEARNYELTACDSARRATLFFWRQMFGGHLFVTGSASDREHFFDPARQSEHLSGYTGETCCTYNLLKLAHHLFCWTADAQVAEYCERALLNHILGQQDPATGMVCYFLPLASGAHKVYSTPDRSFWCCVGSGFESHAKYGETIYYHRGDTLCVNQWIPSRLTWRERGLTLTQRTDFPVGESSVLTLAAEHPVRATILLRRPSWSPACELRVNGRRLRIEPRGGYFALTRTWRDGDRIEIRFPMTLHVETTHDDPSRGALLYGPVVLAGRMGTAGFEGCQPDSDPTRYNDYYTYDYHIPESLNDTLRFDPGRIRRSPGTLHFVTDEGVSLAPLYDIHRERYVVYWHLKQPQIH